MTDFTVYEYTAGSTEVVGCRLYGSAGTSESTQGYVRTSRVPKSVPHDQLYFWSHIWQQREMRALADLEHGRAQEFDSPADAVRWLLGGNA